MLQGAKSVQAKVIDVPSLSKSDFVESEHPRNADGEWTDKGAGSERAVLTEATKYVLRAYGKEEPDEKDYDAIKRLNRWAEKIEDANRRWREDNLKRLKESGILQRPWSRDEEPTWSINARNAYVVNDKRTLQRNGALRRGEPVPESWTNQIDRWAETSVIAKDTTVYRSAIFSNKQAEALQVGSSFVDNAYMSVSDDMDLAKEYADIRFKKSPGAAVMFYISVKKGQECGDAGQNEIVFPRGSGLVITKIVPPSGDSTNLEDENSYWRVYASKGD